MKKHNEGGMTLRRMKWRHEEKKEEEEESLEETKSRETLKLTGRERERE